MAAALVKYDAMCRAIAEAYKVDEVKDLRDKAAALEHYAEQSKNFAAEVECCEIRLRAERRWGELYRDSEKAKAGRPREIPNTALGISDAPPAPTLESMGVSYDQSSRWQALADIPEPEFEAALKGQDRPTTSGLIEAAKPKVTPVATEALRLWSALRDFERENWLAQDREEIMATMVPTMRADVMRLAPFVSECIRRIYDAGTGSQQAAE